MASRQPAGGEGSGLVRRLLSHWLGVGASSAARTMSDPEHAWQLVSEPALWELWMPRVQSLLDAPRSLRGGAYYRVALRQQRGRLGLAPTGPAHIVIDAFEPGLVLAWTLTSGRLVERFRLARDGSEFALAGSGSARAAAVLDELDRQATTIV
jgi:hypothetical protein